MSSGYVAVSGLKMFYEVWGTGEPLVLLHGGALTYELTFGEFLGGLKEGRQVVAVELQGHGRTADVDRTPSFDVLAGDVIAALDQLGLERADFFGFSLGGLVSLELATRHPRRVRRLVLGSTHYRAGGYHEEIRNYADHPDSTRMPTDADFATMQEAHARVAPDPEQFEAATEKFSTLVGALPGWSDDQLRAITAPTLIMIGDTDFVTPDHAVRMHELIPDSRLAILPDTTHMGFLKRPQYVVPMVTEFLA